MSLSQTLRDLENKVKAIEERFGDQFYDMTGFLDSRFKREDRIDVNSTMEYGTYRALCVDTLDDRLQGRVRFYSPYLHNPKLPIKALPYAAPISPTPGFDDCGQVWIPPAGSTIMIVFEGGFSHKPYYIGSVWDRYRGPQGQRVWGYNVEEFYEIHEGHRKGYIIGPGDNGPNDESQVLPQWNTENYHSFDLYSINETQEIALASEDRPFKPKLEEVNYPNIMGWKTPQKHMLKFVDGDYMCNHRWKRLELMSSVGNWMIFKDDHLHPQAQWANPECCGRSNKDCSNADRQPIERLDEAGPCEVCGNFNVNEKCSCTDSYKEECVNPYFKHKNECRPYKGPQTPQNNKMNLPQTGIQLLSLSGHTIIFDDTVEEPSGCPEWERNLQPFDWGCQDRALGKIRIISNTGHRMEWNDEEKEPFTHIRGNRQKMAKEYDGQTFDAWGGRPRNGILLLTATGNRIELNDETKEGCIAGPYRGIFMQSTSNHTFEMKDELNEQCSPDRKEGGVPTPKAKRAFIRIRSGYGLMMTFADYFSQQETQQQFIQILSPQYDACCGPHILHMQERPTCGQVILRAGGDYICSTEGYHVTIVGDDDSCLGPQDKIEMISRNKILDIKNFYYNHADIHVFFAEQYIILAAGRDCPTPAGPMPCLFPVLVGKCIVRCPIFPFMLHITEESLSSRVFASTDNDECRLT